MQTYPEATPGILIKLCGLQSFTFEMHMLLPALPPWGIVAGCILPAPVLQTPNWLEIHHLACLGNTRRKCCPGGRASGLVSGLSPPHWRIMGLSGASCFGGEIKQT